MKQYFAECLYDNADHSNLAGYTQADNRNHRFAIKYDKPSWRYIKLCTNCSFGHFAVSKSQRMLMLVLCSKTPQY